MPLSFENPFLNLLAIGSNDEPKEAQMPLADDKDVRSCSGDHPAMERLVHSFSFQALFDHHVNVPQHIRVPCVATVVTCAERCFLSDRRYVTLFDLGVLYTGND